MRFRLLLTLLALIGALTALPTVADAKSRYKVGFGDQNPQIFSDPNFTSLGIKRVRLIVPWNVQSDPDQAAQTNAWIQAAQARKSEILIAFTARRGCYANGRYSRSKACRAPTPKAFKNAFTAFRKQYPKIRYYQPWNEINSKSQPTFKSPKRAAQYYTTLRKSCRGCIVLGADLLDSSSVTRYAKRFLRSVKGKKPRYWGLHNYSDVNRPRNKGRITRSLMRILPGQIWLTETGGLVKFERNFPYSLKRANQMTRNMFKLADQLSKKRRGYRSRVLRIYPYTFYGETRRERFDAGLVGPLTNPKPRASYQTFKRLARSRSK